MKNFGITLILAGISLIGAMSLDVAKKNHSMVSVATRDVTFIRLFSSIGTVLVIAGVSATVLDKRP